MHRHRDPGCGPGQPLRPHPPQPHRPRVAAFLALTFFAVPFPVVILAAGVIGWALGRVWPAITTSPGKKTVEDGPPPLISDDHLHADQPSLRRSGIILAVGLTAWAVPIIAVGLAFGWHSIFVDQGLFFSGAALLTSAAPTQSCSTSPRKPSTSTAACCPGRWFADSPSPRPSGPLIMFAQFVAFVGAYRSPLRPEPVGCRRLAALLDDLVTSFPASCSFCSRPSVERLRNNHS